MLDLTADQQLEALAEIRAEVARRSVPRELMRVLAISQTPAQSLVRIDTYDGREHLVFPVVMLVGDSVIEPLGATGPEYIPGDILSLGSPSWDGRPIVYDHPMADDGRRGRSANNHATLTSHKIGHLEGTYVENNTLKSTAWIDLDLTKRVEGAGEIITHIMSGGTVEVSIGAWSRYNPVSGEHNGQPYVMSWADAIIPDHLALLPLGRKGACTAEMGCGGPRVNSSQLQETTMAVDTSIDVNVALVDPSSNAFWTRAVATVAALIAKGVPAPVANTSAPTIIATAPCSCGQHTDDSNAPATLTTVQEDTSQMPNAAAIARLRAQFPTATDEQLNELVTGLATDLAAPAVVAATPVATAPNTPTTPPARPEAPSTPVPTPPPPTPAPLTEEQLIAAASQPLRDLIADAKARDIADRTIALTALAGVITQGHFTAEELNAKPTRELRALASMVRPATRFELQGVPTDRSQPRVEPYPKAPDVYGLNKTA